MEVKYNGLYIREATNEERNHLESYWKERFSGYVAVMPDVGTFCVVNSTKQKSTPYGCFRINANHTMLIKANYDSYDTIFLEDEIAVGETLDCDDNF